MRWVPVLLTVCVTLGGCRLLPGADQTPTIGPGKLTFAQVHDRTRALADTFANNSADLWNAVAEQATEQDVVIAAGDHKLANISAAFSIASESAEPVALAELVSLLALLRHYYEKPWCSAKFGHEAQERIVAMHRDFEQQGWASVRTVLTDQQQEELTILITNWVADHPDLQSPAYVRFAEILSAAPTGAARSPDSLFSLFMLDPLAGLDPATREIEQTRLFAERVFYLLDRWPFLLRWHATQLYRTMLADEHVERALDRFDEVSASVDSMPDRLAAEGAKLIDHAREQISAERELAIDQLSAELTAQREQFIGDLDRASATISPTLIEARETIEAADRLSQNLSTAAREVGAVVDRFGKRDDAESVTPPPADDEDKPGGVEQTRALIAEIDSGLGKLSVAAIDLQQLIDSDGWHARRDDVDTMSEDMADRIASLIDRVFIRAGLLVGLITAGTVLVLVSRRRLARA